MSESVRNEEGMNENMNAAIEFVDDARFASIAVMFHENEVSLVSDKSGILYASLSIEGKTFRHKLLTSKNVNVNKLSGLEFAALAALYPSSEVRLEKDEESNSIIATFSIDGKDFGHTLVKYNNKDGVSKSTLLLLDKSFPNSDVTRNKEFVSISIANRTFRYKLKSDESAKVVDSKVNTAKVKALNESDFAVLANCFDDAAVTLKKLTFSEFKKLTGESAAALGEDLSAKPQNNDQYLFASIHVNDVEFLCKLVTYKKINDNDLSETQFALIANLNHKQEVTLKTDKGQIAKCITVDGRNFRKVLVNYGKVAKGITIVNDTNFQWLKDNFADRSSQLTDTKDGIYDTIAIDGKLLGRKILSLKQCSDPASEIIGVKGASIIKLPYVNGCNAALIAIGGRAMYYCIYASNKSEKKKATALVVAFAKREATKIMANTATTPKPIVEDKLDGFNKDADEETLNGND